MARPDTAGERERPLPVADRGQSYERVGSDDFADESFGAGGDYRGDRDFGGFSDQDYGSQGYSGQGYGDRSYGDPDYGGQAFARRGGGESGDFGTPVRALSEGTRGFAHHSAAYADHGPGYGDQGFAGLTYGDHGSAPASAGIGQGFGGQNYDGRGRIRVPSDDMTTAASHRGRGPKGWSRSDERIRDDVCERLHDDAHVDAGEVEVSCDGGVVTLTGSVDSRWAKRHLENLAATGRGVVDVRNQLTVASTRRPDAEDEEYAHGDEAAGDTATPGGRPGDTGGEEEEE